MNGARLGTRTPLCNPHQSGVPKSSCYTGISTYYISNCTDQLAEKGKTTIVLLCTQSHYGNQLQQVQSCSSLTILDSGPCPKICKCCTSTREWRLNSTHLIEPRQSSFPRTFSSEPISRCLKRAHQKDMSNVILCRKR